MNSIYVSRCVAPASMYDLFIGAVGFETRSRFVAQTLKPVAARRIAFAFSDRRLLAFNENVDFYASNDFTIIEAADKEFESAVSDSVGRILESAAADLRICIDISSFTRHRLALIVTVLLDCRTKSRIAVDFLYSIAKYSDPPRGDAPVVQAGPVSQRFAGWSAAPELPTSLILGVGYEADRALGAVEYVEPSDLWVFAPDGVTENYDVAVAEANRHLWADWVADDRRVVYDISNPFQTFIDLQSVTVGCMRDSRPLLLPFGPKVFALLCILVGSLHDAVGVWRVSSGGLEEAADRLPTGAVVGITAEFLEAGGKENATNDVVVMTQ